LRRTVQPRAAPLDTGAPAPLAGLCFAIPRYFWGVARSPLVAISGSPADGMVELGDSLLLHAMDKLALPAIPDGMEPQLSPVAFAAWAGMFVTMINLLPVGQLDGGHVAYALFGTRQNRIAQAVHRAMLGFFVVLVASEVGRDLSIGFGFHRIGVHVNNALFWLVWFQMLSILGALAGRKEGQDPGVLTVRVRLFAMLGFVVVASAGREHPNPILWIAWFLALGLFLVMERKGGVLRPNALLDHPPTGAAPLGPGRTAIAILTLVFFVLLFMPRPISM
jgi:membrane-associated protease RseP (regulator of RpoE activity)